MAAAAAALKGGAVPDQAARAFWCALGHLYTAARTEVMCMGHAAALTGDVSQSPMLMNVRALLQWCPRLTACTLWFCPTLKWTVPKFAAGSMNTKW